MASLCSSDTVFSINNVGSFEGLKNVIFGKLDEMGFHNKCDQIFTDIGNDLKAEEKKYKKITKTLNESASILDSLLKDIRAKENAESEDDVKSISSISIMDDDDDSEVMVIDADTVPITSRNVHCNVRPFQPTSQPLRFSSGQALMPGQPLMLVNENGQLIPSAVASVSANNMLTLPMENIGTSQQLFSMPTIPQGLPRAMTVLNQPVPRPPTLAVGMKLYARKNDVWNKGALVEIQNKDRIFSERKFKIKFDGKGMKVVGSKCIAYSDHPKDNLLVGSRVIALYKDEEHSTNLFYAGIIAEPPSLRNNNRYLVFFDDGYAQYSVVSHLHQVCDQSKQVWEDIHPDSQEFIKGYLQQYPERPMVRLYPGQTIKTEWKGNWWVARVQQVDASLVKMYFDSDKRVEWIYRGSTRLEPLYTELANAEASKQMGKGRRRSNINNPKGGKKPFVEYTRCLEEPEPKKQMSNQVADPLSKTDQGVDVQKPPKAVAKKSTSKPPGLLLVEPPKQASVTSSCEDSQVSSTHVNRADRRLQNTRGNDAVDTGAEGPLGAFVEIDRDQFVRRESLHKTRMPPSCLPSCLRDTNDDPTTYKLKNPLLIPLYYGWERQVTKQRNNMKRGICYRSPCGRVLRNLTEVDRYLMQTNSKLTIDLFCFDPILRIDVEYIPVKTFCDIKDLSYGKENVPISCVNGIDRQYPDYVEYSNQRIPAKGVQLCLEPEFLVGCECKDGCRDRLKCRCIQMTVEATAWSSAGRDEEAGYKCRRLQEPLLTGIFECNSKCKCDSRCHNRVVQHGLTLRLQVFKTERRGWGLRCLDDIPAGGFICIYAGQLLTDEGANEDGKQYGDEYLAELDYIETVEKTKEGYESDAYVTEESSLAEDDASSDAAVEQRDSDSTYSGERRLKRSSKRICKEGKSKSEKAEKSAAAKDDPAAKSKPWPDKAAIKTTSQMEKTQDWLDKMPITISDDELESKEKEIDMEKEIKPGTMEAAENNSEVKIKAKDQDIETLEKVEKKDKMVDKFETKEDVKFKEATDDTTGTALPISVDNVKTSQVEKVEEESSLLVITDPTSLNMDNVDLDSDDDCDEAASSKDKMIKSLEEANNELKRTTRSQTSRFHNLPDPKSQKPVSLPKSKQKSNEQKHDGKLNEKGFVRTRYLFGEECSYTMDAKSMGNLGRYLNHSCSPNAFVQSVFVDTHDLRFPWVAFFAFEYIRAGTELTWDYNYGVGSVPGKVLYCYCGSAECRGRLL